MTTTNELRMELPFPSVERPRLRVEAHACKEEPAWWRPDRLSQVDVRLRPVPEGEAPHLLARELDPGAVEVDAHGDELTVTIRPPQDGWLGVFGGSRRADVTLYVPQPLQAAVRVPAGSIDAEGLHGADLELRNTGGSVRAVGVQGRLEVRARAGRVEVERCSGTLDLRSDVGRVAVTDASGKLEARSEVGRIEVQGFSGSLAVRSNVGAVDLDLAELTPGSHEVRSNVGHVRVRLPHGAPVHVAIRTDVGRVHNRFPPAASPKATLEIRTSVGGVTVEPSGSPADVEERRRRREEERMRILTMVEQREISAQEAADLLESLE
ncbi:MAG TPA: DUF4097 family beta strand repeat-containing protein [Dehalococcoidia bacterium]